MSGCVCVRVCYPIQKQSLVVIGITNTGEIYSVPAVCIPTTGESIPDVECMGKVVAIGINNSIEINNVDPNAATAMLMSVLASGQH